MNPPAGSPTGNTESGAGSLPEVAHPVPDDALVVTYGEYREMREHRDRLWDQVLRLTRPQSTRRVSPAREAAPE